MADVNPLKLVDLGDGQGQLREMESGDRIPAALLPQLTAPVISVSASRSLGLADCGAYLRVEGAGEIALTIPAQSLVPWPDGAEIHLRRAAAAELTITPGSGVVLLPPAGGSLIMVDRMSVTLKRAGGDVWDVLGQTVSA